MASVTDSEYEVLGLLERRLRGEKRNTAPSGTDGTPFIGWWGSSISCVDKLANAADVRQLLPQKSSFIANWISRWLFGAVPAMKP
jgi:hypothetical protein